LQKYTVPTHVRGSEKRAGKTLRHGGVVVNKKPTKHVLTAKKKKKEAGGKGWEEEKKGKPSCRGKRAKAPA